MIPKPIEMISKTDIEDLVAAQVGERRTLDYKEELPGGRDEDKREFLYDASSFANASGGDLVYGITEKRDAAGKPTGLPGAVDGVPLPNLSDAVARLENLIRDGIKPRIQGIQWRSVDGFQKGPVLILRIPKSLVGPHMVVFGGLQRFYSRNNTGKYPLDVAEIRSAFMESSAIGERLREIREQRLHRVLSGASPFGLVATPMILLHILPLPSLADLPRDVTKDASRLLPLLEPIRGGSRGGRFNFDGFLVTSAEPSSYVQVFRSGAIEAGDARFLSEMPEQYKSQFPSIALERDLIHSIEQYLKASSLLSTPLPLFVAISLLRVTGFTMSSYPLKPFPGNEGVDREMLELPEVIVEDYSANVGRLLRPAFDALWQACGIEQSANYDTAGNWRPHA